MSANRAFAGHRSTNAPVELKGQNLTVVPVCPYVIAYLEEHPELAPLDPVSGGGPLTGGA